MQDERGAVTGILESGRATSQNAQDLLETADQQLYRRKRKVQNRNVTVG
jgi:GGDEF domain-containing protein